MLMRSAAMLALIQENPLDKENVQREQAKDAFCTK